jgi:chorismate dehydratase
MTVVRRNNPLPRTRIGAVPYLNAIPLIYGLEDRVQFFSPAKLSDAFDAGQIDVGLLPIVEYFKEDARLILPRIAIGTAGAVRSVKLFLNKPLRDLRRVGVDRRSRTSAMLLRVILEMRYKLAPQYVPIDPEKDFSPFDHDGILMIGDQAMSYDKITEAIDLGAEWVQWTGLPFVFACWQVRRVFSDYSVMDLLEKAAVAGKDKIDHIASLVPGLDPAAVREYFKECLCYDLGEDQEHAIELFVRFLTQLRVPLREKKIEYFDRRDLGKGLLRVTP